MNTQGQPIHQKPWNYLRVSSSAPILVVLVLAALFTPAHSQTFHVLYSFSGSRDGANPYGGLIRDAQGNIYGTTIAGGSRNSLGCYGTGCGVAFKLNAAGKETVLFSFDLQASGSAPNAGLIRDAQGNLYGTLNVGGDANCNPPFGCGIVFEIEASGQEKTLYSFKGGADGARPTAALIRDSAGNLYGTTWEGGPANEGTVFKLDPAGHETVLYAFTGKEDGSWPIGALIRDAQGNLYGTTELGGNLNGCGTLGCGVVYKISAAGGETVLYRFSGGADGSEAGDALVRDAAGNLYGTTGLGGDLSCDAPYGCGVIFKLDQTGTETVLYRFTGGATDGSDPIGGVARDSSGKLYGTTYRSGADNLGTVFKLDASGHESLLHSFTGKSDGAFPYAGVILDAAGNLYGTAVSGGKSGCSGEGCGVVFKIAP